MVRKMATAQISSEQRLVLSAISWREYLHLLHAFDERRIRITYDRGDVEIMTVSSAHERLKCLINLLIATLVEELGWNVASYGNTTFKRRKRRRGLEPDECYWIQNESLVRGKDRIDLRREPPPDLALEIEVSQSVLNRLSIYPALGFPEVWRLDGQTIRVQLLGLDGRYAESSQSRVFPFLPMAELVRHLSLASSMSETDMVRQFRCWVRDRIAAGWQ
jgi:Uma2 family endonuclease